MFRALPLGTTFPTAEPANISAPIPISGDPHFSTPVRNRTPHTFSGVRRRRGETGGLPRRRCSRNATYAGRGQNEVRDLPSTPSRRVCTPALTPCSRTESPIYPEIRFRSAGGAAVWVVGGRVSGSLFREDDSRSILDERSEVGVCCGE